MRIDNQHAGTGRRCRDDDAPTPGCDRAQAGWAENVAHPSAPQGGGGPGMFADNRPLGGAEGGPASPTAPTPAHPQSPAIPLDNATLLAALKKNPPPATSAQKSTLKTKTTPLVKVEIQLEVLADGSTTNAAIDGRTSFAIPSSAYPGYESADGKITKFDGQFTWKGTLTIQTVYGPGASSQDLSCYGRGTTAEDVRRGDITLGFHESCHRADYLAYLKDQPLPDPPDLKLGMKVDAYLKSIEKFKAEFKAYETSMKQDSYQRTDNVGHKRSDVKRTGKCYVHKSS